MHSAREVGTIRFALSQRRRGGAENLLEMWNSGVFGAMLGLLEELAELLGGQARIPSDPTHRDCLDRIVPRNGHLPGAVTHDDVLALPDDLEARFPQGADGILVVDAGNARHG